MTHPEVVCEWDAEELLGVLVVGCPRVDDSWRVVSALWETMDARGVGHTLEELRERRFTDGRCVPWNGARQALLWRMTFDAASDARHFAALVAHGLGVELEGTLEE